MSKNYIHNRYFNFVTGFLCSNTICDQGLHCFKSVCDCREKVDKHKKWMEKLQQKTLIDSYAECYPG